MRASCCRENRSCPERSAVNPAPSLFLAACSSTSAPTGLPYRERLSSVSG